LCGQTHTLFCDSLDGASGRTVTGRKAVFLQLTVTVTEMEK